MFDKDKLHIEKNGLIFQVLNEETGEVDIEATYAEFNAYDFGDSDESIIESPISFMKRTIRRIFK